MTTIKGYGKGPTKQRPGYPFGTGVPKKRRALPAVAKKRMIKPPARKVKPRVGGATREAIIRARTPGMPKVGITGPGGEPRYGKPPKYKPKPVGKVPPPKDALPGVRGAGALQTAAEGQVDAELSGQITPLQSQVGATQGRETAAQQELERMFGQLQPAVSDAMHLVSDNYDKTLQAEQALFSTAGTKLNQLKQDAAAEAQKMAQTVGGPVAVDKFTGAVDPSIAAFGPESAGSLLHSMGLHQTAREEQAAWAGKVFPLIRVEKEMGTRAKYEADIKELEDKITALKGTRTGAVNARFNELLGKEREYALQKTQQQLDKVKANRDWQATVHTLKNDDARLSLAGYQAKTGVQLKGRELALRAKKLTADQRIAAAKLNMSAQQFAAKLAQSEESLRIQRQKLGIQRQKNAIAMAKAMANPASIKPMTLTHKRYFQRSANRALYAQMVSGKRKDIQWDPKKHQFYHYMKETITPAVWAQRQLGGIPIRDPKKMFQILRKQFAVPPAVARAAVIKETGKDPQAK
jgi:hypothetical protein